MKHQYLPFLGALLMAQPLLRHPLAAQSIDVTFTIAPGSELGRISPYVYGTNGQSDDRDENVTARRAGGNRWTGYNWENNASNAGEDYINHSDDYLSWMLPESVQQVPGIVVTSFHDTSLATGAYSLITLQAAGYVARDKKGTVSQGETAPSSRWVEVVPAKGAPFSTVPDTTDGRVYLDEELSFLVGRYGGAATPTGIRGYSIDNEPGLWPSTHPRIHPGKTTVREVIDRGIATATAVKRIDPAAEVFGPTAYGFNEYRNMQDAPDWSQYQSYGTFLNAYLDAMRSAETAAGHRLLDVLDLHWYPEAQGRDAQGNLVRIALNESADSGVAAARMQAPRSLWDSSYTEESWIGTWFSPVALIPAVKASIAQYYPGTKLAFTELNYGGSGHVSGGIAMADVLGIFGRYGVYMANHWEALDGYISSAYRLYRNYDGGKSTFGDVAVSASASDLANASVHASRDSKDTTILHVVVLNKNLSRRINGHFTLGGEEYRPVAAYGFDASGPQLRQLDMPAAQPAASFEYSLAPTSATHFVLRRAAAPASVAGGDRAASPAAVLSVAPNPTASSAEVRFALAARGPLTITLVDALGRQVATLARGEYGEGEHVVRLDRAGISAGAYLLRLTTAGGQVVTPVTILR